MGIEKMNASQKEENPLSQIWAKNWMLIEGRENLLSLFCRLHQPRASRTNPFLLKCDIFIAFNNYWVVWFFNHK
jgi:hypothetical protein